MGNVLIRHIKCCFQSDNIPDKLLIIPGLCDPDGKLLSVEGLRVDFIVETVFKSRLIQIKFTSNVSGHKYQVYQCLYVPDLPLTTRSEEIEEVFKLSTRNVAYITKDHKHFYEGKVTICIDNITYDLGEYLMMKGFSRFQTLSRKSSPRYNHPTIPENFPVNIKLDEEYKTEKIEDKNITDNPFGNLKIHIVSDTAGIASPKNDHVERTIDDLKIIENKF